MKASLRKLLATGLALVLAASLLPASALAYAESAASSAELGEELQLQGEPLAPSADLEGEPQLQDENPAPGAAAEGEPQVQDGDDAEIPALEAASSSDLQSVGMQDMNVRALSVLSVGGAGVRQVSLGSQHSAAVKDDGTLWTWGWNHYGQLGDGTGITYRSSPVKVMDGVASVSLGEYHSAAVKTDGSLWTWGYNYFGQLGNGRTNWFYSPFKVMDGVASVSLGRNHSAAVKTDGSLWTWGWNEYGQLGGGSSGSYRLSPAKVMDGVASASLGGYHSAAVKDDGSLWTWGRNDHGQLGDGTTAERHSPAKVMGGVASASLGTWHSAAVKDDGSLWTWGSNSQGRLGDGTTAERHSPAKVMDGVASASLGDIHSAAIKTDGTLWMWGSNYRGRLGDGTTATGSTIERHSPVQITLGSGTPSDPSEEVLDGNLLIERVKAYTSQPNTNIIGEIMSNPNYSEEQNWKRVNEWFNYKGFLDAKEGIQYWKDTQPQRSAYQYLVNNDIYCANNFCDWINSDEGTPARAALYSSALILNTEFLDWSIDSLSNYMTMETPGIKKYKSMLLDFVKKDTTESEVCDYINEASSFVASASSVLKANEVHSAKEAIKEAGSVSEVNLVLQNVLSGVLDKDGSVILNIEDSMLGKALGTATQSIGFAFDAYEDVTSFLDLELNFERYKTYESFLKEVYSSGDIPFELRVAALQVCDDFENSHKEMIEKATAQAAGYITEGVLDVSGFSATMVGQAVALIKFGTVVSNLLIDVGGFVERESAVEGYAYLARHFKHNLVQDCISFRAEPTLANAKSFHRDYSLLYELRLAGEDAYIKMSTVEGFVSRLTDFGLAEKKAVADETRNHLMQNCKFSFAGSVPSGDIDMSPYERKVIVACPVAVEIKDAGGNVVCSLEDGTATDVTNEHGRFVCFYNAFEGSWSKVAYLRSADSLGALTLTARDDGLVTCSVSCKQEAADGSIEASVYSFDKRSMSKDSVLVADCTSDGAPSAVLTGSSGEQAPVEMISADSGQSVTGITSTKTDVTLREGESAVLDVEVLPSNASDKSVLWTSSNPSIVSVVGGTINALAVGDATITAKTLDGGYSHTFAVSVAAIAVESVSLDKMEASLTGRDSVQLSATVSPDNAANKNVSWSSSDEHVATVDESGNVTAVGKGTVTITATTEDGGKTATCQVTVSNPATSLAFDEAELSVKRGQQASLALAARGELEGSVDDIGSVEWTSSDPEVATVSGSGLSAIVNGAKVGTATITVKAIVNGAELSADCDVDVTGIAVESVTLSEASKTVLLSDGPFQLRATVLPVDADNSAVAWSSSNSTVASVDATGLVTPVSAGTTTISASAGGILTSCELTVTDDAEALVSVESVELSETKLALVGAQTHLLKAIVHPDNASNKDVLWASSDDSVATVSDTGLVTSVGRGVATITATTKDGGKTASCEVTVEERPPENIPVSGVSLDPAELKLSGVGATGSIKATVLPDNATDKSVSWTSSNPAVATVDENGAIASVSAGEATITASAGGHSAQCKVVVELPTPDGSFTVDGAAVELGFSAAMPGGTSGREVRIVAEPVSNGIEYAAILARIADDSRDFASAFDVKLSIDGVLVDEGFGSLSLTFPVGEKYNGRNATVYHCHRSDRSNIIEYDSVVVEDGKVTIDGVDKLSTFGVGVEKEQAQMPDATDTPTNTDPENPGTQPSEDGEGKPQQQGTQPDEQTDEQADMRQNAPQYTKQAELESSQKAVSGLPLAQTGDGLLWAIIPCVVAAAAGVALIVLSMRRRHQ